MPCQWFTTTTSFSTTQPSKNPSKQPMPCAASATEPNGLASVPSPPLAAGSTWWSAARAPAGQATRTESIREAPTN